ncbi:MAG: YncE family protein [Balneola sp.]
MRKNLLYLFTALLFVSTACDSNNSESKVTLNGVFVLNEGNITRTNASITAYNPETKEVSQNQYENENGVPIGDVLNSVTEIGDRLYLVVNNSHKIEVVDKESLTKIATIRIANEASPRQLAKVSDSKAYVTNLYGNSVSIINLETNEVDGTIAVGANPEGIAVVGEKAYITNSGLGNGNTITVINTSTDEVSTTLTIGDNPSSIIKDDSNRLWVVCVGAYGDWNDPDDNGTPGEIYVLNGSTGETITNFEVGGHPGDLVLNDRDDIAYLMNGTVMSIDMNSFDILNSTFINRNFYSLGLSTSDDGQFLWGGDAKNFAQAGLAVQYELSGAKIDSFPTGIIPGAFYFSAE